MVNWKTVLTCLVTAVLLGLGGYAIDFQTLKAKVTSQDHKVDLIYDIVKDTRNELKEIRQLIK